MKRTFTIATSDETAFLRLMVAAAGIGTFAVTVTEQATPQVSKPPDTSTIMRGDTRIGPAP